MASIANYGAPQGEQIGFSFSEQNDAAGTRQHAFYPYTDNGGSTLGITGMRVVEGPSLRC
jgi:20S proteasome subunit beta 6